MYSERIDGQGNWQPELPVLKGNCRHVKLQLQSYILIVFPQSIYNITGKSYKYGATYHVIYPATGAAIDWMYYTGVALSFGVELGEDGGHGFLMPSENIEPTGQELLVAVKELLKNLDPELIKMRGQGDSWF